MEEEWKFVKDICSYTQGGECKAGYKFWYLVLYFYRNSPPEVLGKGVLKTFNKFTGDHPCRCVI